jgi:hypothetical protein
MMTISLRKALNTAATQAGYTKPWAHSASGQDVFKFQKGRFETALKQMRAQGEIGRYEASEIMPGRKNAPKAKVWAGVYAPYDFSEGDYTMGGLEELAYMEYTLHRDGREPLVVTLSHHPCCDTYFIGPAVLSARGKRMDVSGTSSEGVLQPTQHSLNDFVKFIRKELAKPEAEAAPVPEAVAG